VTSFRSRLLAVRHACRFARNRLFPRASYADDREDQLVCKLLGGIQSFVDVGANDGVSSSNTALAVLRGARGLCFEPNPAVFLRLAWYYRWVRRVECVREGISDITGHLELRCDGLLSAMPATEDKDLSRLLAKFQQENARLIQVPVSRLGDWLARRPDLQGCDLVSIDVEGHELSVLRGMDWMLCPKPGRVFVIETHANSKGRQVWRHRDFDDIATLLAERGYIKLAASRNNTIWLHREELAEKRLSEARASFPDYTWFVA
jgi:FkbM family methyltransferase